MPSLSLMSRLMIVSAWGFLLATVPSQALAMGGSDTLSLGVLLGPAIQSQGGTNLGFELEGGYRVLPAIWTGIYYWKASSGADVSSGGGALSSSQSLSSIGVQALYDFPGTRWSGGVKLGLMKNSVSGSFAPSDPTLGTTQLSDTKSSVMVAPTLLYQIPAGFLVVGGEASYLYSLSDAVPKALSLMAEASIRF